MFSPAVTRYLHDKVELMIQKRFRFDENLGSVNAEYLNPWTAMIKNLPNSIEPVVLSKLLTALLRLWNCVKKPNNYRNRQM